MDLHSPGLHLSGWGSGKLSEEKMLSCDHPRNSSPSCESRRKQISLSKAYIYIDNIYK
ncbi:hypothetical protein AAZX31_20G001900 [Glycine max]|uniref:Uncharacterized protein n=1 Tax=Glycine max TaxID=3847 RepID=A0A0R0E4N9_SOYBN|nr:hypothetical protein JHK87_054886 [Glycine soja]KAH1033870.1 hypothetical protein GYH30_054334 [Glycine max]KRG89117.1 hypothetical protein GLYMA_20G002100v4 [Glycine max]